MTAATHKIRNLPVELTEQEREQRAQHLAQLIQKRAKLIEDRRTANGVAYRETREVDTQIKVLSDVVATGKEIREVEVEERKNLRERVLSVVRLDTKEVIDSRQLTIEETQGDLPLERVQGEHSVQHVAREDDDGDPTPRSKRKRPGANA